MNIIIPPQLNEACSGAVFLMMVFFVVFLAFWLLKEYRHNPLKRLFDSYEFKAAFGMFTMFCGLAAKNGVNWWYLHIRNQGQLVNYPIMLPIFIAGTLVSLWGMVCLMRALAPYEWGSTRWIWLAFFAVAFGISFAL